MPPVRGWVVAGLLFYAACILIACIVPFTRGGNPYPDGTFQYWAIGLGILVVCCIVAALRLPDKRWPFPDVSPAVFATLVGIVTVALASALALIVFSGGPSTSDEIAQSWHAKILLAGHLSLPPDPNPEFFALDTVVDQGRWYSQFPIGGAVIAIVGVLTEMPWLTNACLAGASCAALYCFARRAYGETIARIASALFAVAPMVVFMAATWMNHVAVLFLTTVCLALVVHWDQAQSARRLAILAAGLGVAVGLMAAIRPLDAAVLAVVLGGFQVWRSFSSRPHRVSIAVQLVAGVTAVLPLFYANRATTGAATKFGYEALWGAGHGIGFHVDPYGVPHTLGRGLEYVYTYLGELNLYLLAWPVPVLVIVIATLVMLRQVNRWDLVMMCLLAGQTLAYGAYWHDGAFLGPRFLFNAIPALMILIARAPILVTDRLGRAARVPVVLAVVGCVLVTWGVPGLPVNALGLARQARTARPRMKFDIGGAVGAAGIHNAVVFVREPFTARLTRRLWGLGLDRSTTARLVGSTNICSLFIATRAVAPGAVLASGEGARVLKRAADSILAMRESSPASAPDSATAACVSELETDSRLGTIAFGPALLLETIEPDGHIGGDVIYVADLGDHNEVLRSRFAARQWYRFQTGRDSAGRLVSMIRPY